MTYLTEFPDFPVADLPAIPATFVDTSWHNDTCPSFASDVIGLTIFIDYADTAKREFPESQRFTVQSQDHGVETSGPSLDTDDWSEVLAFVTEHTKTLISNESLGACSQPKLDVLNDTIEKLFSQIG